MKIIVLGAGVIGVTSAWYLAKAGHEVTVIDRQPVVGLETSFANGGQISASHAEPWANPQTPFKILSWLFQKNAPLLFRPRLDWQQWRWGLHFLYECLPARSRKNTQQILNLALYSRYLLRSLREETGIQYQARLNGVLHIFTFNKDFKKAKQTALIMREYGCDLSLQTPEECVQTESALKHAQSQLVGGVYSALDESGDAHQFTQNLAALCLQRGVKFIFNAQLKEFILEKNYIKGVKVNTHNQEEFFQADAYLVCLGSYSPLFLRPIGIDILVYPAKGYSVTLPIDASMSVPNVSLTHDEYKIVISRLGNFLRIAGTAELNGYNTEINFSRCQAILRHAQALFPDLKKNNQPQFWMGLRPATPSNVPYIGGTRYANLFLNTGHGTLGWTLACGSGKLIADKISDQQPEVKFCFS